LLEEFRDVVVVQPKSATERARPDPKGFRGSRSASLIQGRAEQVVDELFKGTTRFAHFRLELRRDILVERESGSHIMMLYH
jgi:hypothetical protein